MAEVPLLKPVVRSTHALLENQAELSWPESWAVNYRGVFKPSGTRIIFFPPAS